MEQAVRRPANVHRSHARLSLVELRESQVPAEKMPKATAQPINCLAQGSMSHPPEKTHRRKRTAAQSCSLAERLQGHGQFMRRSRASPPNEFATQGQKSNPEAPQLQLRVFENRTNLKCRKTPELRDTESGGASVMRREGNKS
jgi:hypothetical protein